MQTKYIQFFKKTLVFATICVGLTGILLTPSCKKEEGTNGVTVLNSFGPCPVARGAELRFIGQNLDKVDTIILPGNIVITSTSFSTKTSTLISITVPQNAIPGFVTLKSPDGPIVTKTELGFSEPISITSFSPASAKKDSVITITGDYLNLIKQVIFTSNVTVNQADFVSQSRYQLQVKVPDAAQTGKISISNGADNPIIIYSTGVLAVTLPAITNASPNPVKAGTMLTITGTDLDLVRTMVFGGNKRVTTFSTQTLTQLVVTVPIDAQDDTLQFMPASGVVVKAIPKSKLVMVVPTVNISPTTIKNGADLTVTGTDLDLVDHVTFGGNVNGTIKSGGTSTQILVTVPNTAVSGHVNFVTKANKMVDGGALTIVDPVFTSFSPSSGKANSVVAIMGTDLDLVTNVAFTGGLTGTIASDRTSSQLNVTIPVGAKTGNIKLLTKNGDTIQSPSAFTVLANLPTINTFTEPSGVRGQILTINGTSMLLIKELVFPGNVSATQYGAKSDTKVEVYVPTNAVVGYGTIKMITYEGEQGITPQVFIGGTDPIADPLLMINDFETHSGHDMTWDNWGGNAAAASDPSIKISGNYMVGTNTATKGWTWIWGCNHDQLPKPASISNTSNYVLKIDINITKPLASGGSFDIEFAGTKTVIGMPGMQNGGSYSTVGWVTQTWDLSTLLKDNGDGTTSPFPSSITVPAGSEWGLILTSGTYDLTGFYIDNIRFEHK